MPDSPMEFGPFDLLNEIASGGMATVYKARLRTTTKGRVDRLMAIKRIHGAFGTNPQFVKMFVDEARICSRLRHRCIVEVYELGKFKGEMFMAMELVEGVDLLKAMLWFAKQGKGMPPAIAVHIAAEIGDALAYAHNVIDKSGNPLKIVHRDVSPRNILLSRKGHVKLVDFGIARASDNEAHTIAGTLKGKYSYMSPEHILGGSVDSRCDVFALGVVLAEMLMGRPLFTSPSPYDTLMMINEVNLERLDKHGAAIPEHVRALIGRALMRDPTDRYTSMEFRNALTNWLEQRQEQSWSQAISKLVERVESTASSGEVRAPLVVGETSKLTAVAEEAAAEGRKQYREAVSNSGLLTADERKVWPEFSASMAAAFRTPPPTSKIDTALDSLLDNNPQLFNTPSSRLAFDEELIIEDSDTVFLLGEPKEAVAALALNPDRTDEAKKAVQQKRASTLPHWGVALPAEDRAPELSWILETGTEEEQQRDPALTKTIDMSAVSPIKLLFRLAQLRSNGRLDFELSTIRKRAYFRNGDAYFVESNLASESLETVLIKLGKVSDFELTIAKAVLSKFDNNLEKTLVGLNLIEPRELIRIGVGRIRMQLIEVCSWTKGTANWFLDETCEDVADSARADTFELLGASVLLLTEEFVTEWASKLSDEPVFLRSADFDPKRFSLGYRIDSLSSLCDGQNTIQQMKALCPSKDAWLDTLRVLYLLDESELVNRWHASVTGTGLRVK